MATTAAVTAGRTPGALVQYAWGVVGYNVLVILWGALVRATGSGAGCGNHWPLCNGEVIPLSPRIDTVIEFTHRCMTGGAAFVVLGLLVWTFRATVKGQAARVMAVASMVLLLNEAVLGALLVKLGYVTGNQSVGRVVVLSIHLSNTLLLLAALTLTAVMLGTGQVWRELGVKGDKKALGFAGARSNLGCRREWVTGSAGGYFVPCFLFAGCVRSGLRNRIAMAAPAARDSSRKRDDRRRLRHLADEASSCRWRKAAVGRCPGAACISVFVGARRCLTARSCVDADSASTGGGSVLGRTGSSRHRTRLATCGVAYIG